MSRCDECGKRISSPYTCSYCNRIFCKTHAHVDNHTCVKPITKPKRSAKYTSQDDLYYRKDKTIQKTSAKKYLLTIFLLATIIAPIFSLYMDRELVINNIEITNSKALSGEKITLNVNATVINNNNIFRSIAPSFGAFLGTEKEFNLSIDEKDPFKVLVEAEFSKNKIIEIDFLEINPGKHILRIEDEMIHFEILNQSKMIIEEVTSSVSNPRIWEPTELSISIRNLGYIDGDPIINVYSDKELIEIIEVSICSLSTEVIQIVFQRKNPNTYDIRIEGATKNFTYSIEVSEPSSNIFSDLDYYYLVAELYVNENYDVPSEKNIEGLSMLLEQIRLPEYEVNKFDCSDCSAMIEWLVEGAGFEAHIVHNHGWGEIVAGPHAWVHVETLDGLVAVEATALTAGHDLPRTGIVSKPDGKFLEYSTLYKRYEQWMEDYPSHIYDYPSNLSFDDWCDDYLIPVVQQTGIPSNAGYYSEKYRFDSPKVLTEGITVSDVHYYQEYSELDWWNHPLYNNKNPFQYWN